MGAGNLVSSLHDNDSSTITSKCSDKTNELLNVWSSCSSVPQLPPPERNVRNKSNPPRVTFTHFTLQRFPKTRSLHARGASTNKSMAPTCSVSPRDPGNHEGTERSTEEEEEEEKQEELHDVERGAGDGAGKRRKRNTGGGGGAATRQKCFPGNCLKRPLN